MNCSLITLDDNFSGFRVSVTGYTLYERVAGQSVSAFVGHTDPQGAGLAADQFWILLQENTQLDTGSTPTWTITQNTSLADNATHDYLVGDHRRNGDAH